jgi:hypothetical protein
VLTLLSIHTYVHTQETCVLTHIYLTMIDEYAVHEREKHHSHRRMFEACKITHEHQHS